MNDHVPLVAADYVPLVAAFTGALLRGEHPNAVETARSNARALAADLRTGPLAINALGQPIDSGSGVKLRRDPLGLVALDEAGQPIREPRINRGVLGDVDDGQGAVRILATGAARLSYELAQGPVPPDIALAIALPLLARVTTESLDDARLALARALAEARVIVAEVTPVAVPASPNGTASTVHA